MNNPRCNRGERLTGRLATVKRLNVSFIAAKFNRFTVVKRRVRHFPPILLGVIHIQSFQDCQTKICVDTIAFQKLSNL